MTDMKWKRLSFCGTRSWSEILAVGEMAGDKRLAVWCWNCGGPNSTIFLFMPRKGLRILFTWLHCGFFIWLYRISFCFRLTNFHHDVSVSYYSRKWRSQGHCWQKPLSRGRLWVQRPLEQTAARSVSTVNGSHMLTLSHLLFIVPTTSSLYPSFSFFHTSSRAHTQFPQCGKIDGMFPNHRCCSTCESFTFLTTQFRPPLFLLPLTVPPWVVISMVSQSCRIMRNVEYH